LKQSRNTPASQSAIPFHITYKAAGAVTSMQFGNAHRESTQFNSRLQPLQIALGSTKTSLNSTQSATDILKLDYDFGTTSNKRNVLFQTITVPTEIRNNQTYNGFMVTQSYVYDLLNCLNQAIETISG